MGINRFEGSDREKEVGKRREISVRRKKRKGNSIKIQVGKKKRGERGEKDKNRTEAEVKGKKKERVGRESSGGIGRKYGTKR